jgi:ankyrin repeat protein
MRIARRLMVLAVFLLVAPALAAPNPAKARKKLADEGLDFDAKTFMDLVDDGDMKKVNLFLEAGFDVNSAGARGRTALHEAAAADDGKMVPVLLKAGARTEVPDEGGVTPLCTAADEGVAMNVQALLAAKASVTVACGMDKETPLHLAADEGCVPCVQALIAAGAPLEARQRHAETPLYDAVYRHQAPAVAALIAAGADVNSKTKSDTPLHAAVNGRQAEIVKMLLAGGAQVDIRNMRGETPLFEAARNDSADIIAILLASGADPAAKDSGKQTPMEIAKLVKAASAQAALQGAKKVAVAPVPTRPAPGRPAAAASAPAGDPKAELQRLGLTMDAKTWWERIQASDANAVALFLKAGFAPGTRNDNGRTALYEAIENDSVDVVKALLANGANADDAGRETRVIQGMSLDYGQTPLMAAVDEGDLALVQALLEAKANPNLAGKSGNTALMGALQQKHTDIVKALLAGGADPNAKDKAGTPTMYSAVQFGDVEMVKAMLAAGAKLGTGPKRKLVTDAAQTAEMKALLAKAP